MKLLVHKPLFGLLLVLCLGIAFRVIGINWDQAAFLHPDERFLVMVSNSLETPKDLFEYLDPNQSSFNAVQAGHEFYVYGDLPPVVHHVLSEALGKETFLEKTLLGRSLSMLLDVGVIVLIYAIVHVLEKPLSFKKETKLWAAFLYAVAVLPIQLAHFFTVDPFTQFFSLLGIYFSLRYLLIQQKPGLIVVTGVAFALALASKLSAVYPLILAGAILTWGGWTKQKQKFLSVVLTWFIFGLTLYLGLRFLSPGYFESSNILEPYLNATFRKNIELLSVWTQSDTWFPPSIQWLNLPWWFAGRNLILFGYGLIPSVLAGLGVTKIIRHLQQKKQFSPVGLIIIWVFGFFLWQSFQFVKTMRYFLFLYPWLAFFSAVGIESLTSFSKHKNYFLKNIIILIAILIWPLAFLNIYLQPHSRVQASRWLIENLPERSTLLVEYWDDALPVGQNLNYTQKFTQENLYVFNQESQEKSQLMKRTLRQGDYYILSSNRAWESIRRNPDRYPKTSAFYAQLFAQETPYELLKTFEVRPSLRWLGIPLDFPDQHAEEAFTVYDHPKVWIFKNSRNPEVSEFAW